MVRPSDWLPDDVLHGQELALDLTHRKNSGFPGGLLKFDGFGKMGHGEEVARRITTE
jgi:hypothetical protein